MDTAPSNFLRRCAAQRGHQKPANTHLSGAAKSARPGARRSDGFFVSHQASYARPSYEDFISSPAKRQSRDAHMSGLKQTLQSGVSSVGQFATRVKESVIEGAREASRINWGKETRGRARTAS